MKGLIVLDIDGTAAKEGEPLSIATARELSLWVASGWYVAFMTGRPLLWARRALENAAFPYALAVNNGALLQLLPSGEIIRRCYLTLDAALQMEKICCDFVLYNENECYYRPACFAEELLNFVEGRAQALQEKWVPLADFSALPVKEFASLKCFGSEVRMREISGKLEGLRLHAPVIRDPYAPSSFVMQATHAEATKGCAAIALKGHFSAPLMIAAGDDDNDSSIFKVADIKVVMATAPHHLLAMADIVAPPAREEGLIQVLHELKEMR